MTQEQDMELLAELNANYVRSVAEADVVWFTENLSADFLNSNPDGSLVDKAGFLKQVAPPAKVPDLTFDDLRIRLFENIAIIHGRTGYCDASGHRHSGRYTDIWSRQEGRWLCVAAQVYRG